MKKIIVFLLICISANIVGRSVVELKDTHFTGEFTAGYVFKHNDHIFKSVYGLGMVNVITADGCYNRCNHLGVGAKISYWLAAGKTTFLKRHTLLQEVPIIFYLRGMIDLKRGLRLYASLGGGPIWIQERSYLGKPSTWKGIGEAELGFICPVWHHCNFTTALRYLFPRQRIDEEKRDIGGFDLRAGFGFSY